ncbi:hypothetical protein [Bacillus tropicus]|uniref:hypothetical protein n=1 Tax=Bacillus tropicus TaxID=2026188 RepID=UPI0021D306B3|nr:hypothetical protein [Bacillus tropicus]MCU5225969.1 hypothetical protein [Bacillus tropicus]
MTKYYIIRIYATLHKNYLLLHAILKQESTIVIFFLFLKQYGYIFLTSFGLYKQKKTS